MSNVPRFARLDGRATRPLATEERLLAGQANVPEGVDESALEPAAVSDLRAQPAHHGVFVTWSSTEPVVGFRVSVLSGQKQVRAEYVPAAVSAAFVGKLDVGESYRIQVAALHAGRVGETATSGEVQPVTSPLAPEVAEELATAYVRADAELMLGHAETATAAATAADPHARHTAGVSEALTAAEVEQRKALRDRLVQRGLRYVNFVSNVVGTALVPTEKADEVVLHVIVDETWSIQLDDGGPEEITDSRGIRRYSVTCGVEGGGVVRSVARGDEFGPAQGAPPDEEPSETDATPPEPAESGGGSEGEPEPLAVNNRAIVRYAHQWFRVYNDDFTSYDNDCTNFASQCCQAGGLKQITGWYRSDEAWWYNGNWATYCSYPWRVANSLFNHLWKKKRARFRKWIENGRAGDVLFWDFDGNGDIDHVSIINANRGGRLFYAQHSDSYWNRPLEAGLHGHPKAKVYIADLTG